jgi:hypothetical protein
MPNPKYLTADEIVATIVRSAFPSVVTEGDHDVIVLRRLEEEFADIGLTLIPAGGKSAVLAVFDRRHTLPAKRALFIADRDIWVVCGIPPIYVSVQLILTDGYSIENDMFRDGDLETLLTAKERAVFAGEMQIVCRWYALAMSRCIAGQTVQLDIHPSALLDNETHRSKLMELQTGEVYPETLAQRVSADYARLLRGHALFSLLIKQCKGQRHSHRTLANFGAFRRGPFLSLIIEGVRTYFS